MTKKSKILPIVLLALLATSCRQSVTPKPRGYFRIDFPQKNYRTFDSIYPFRCKIPTYTQVTPMKSTNSWTDFLNIEAKQYKACIHLTYMDIANNLDLMIEDAYAMAYKHTQKADAIDESVFVNEQKHVYGLLYDIQGNSASSVQFFLTDSVKHYLRGALYFRCEPNKDSLAPSIRFFRDDVMKLIETMEWKK